VAKDATYQTAIYDQLGGTQLQFSSTEGMGARMEFDGVPAGLKITFAYAAGAANHCVVTLRVQDFQGNNLQQVFDLDFYLSDSSTGVGVSATAPSGGYSITTGTSLNIKVTGLAGEALTDGTGKLVVNITDTAKTLYFPAAEAPGTGVTWVGPQLQTSNYG
jgi:hypothetical protein